MHSVLVIDDDRTLRAMVGSWVQACGFEAREATGSADALQQMGRRAADIALCDVNMPGENGVWLAAQIRERFPRTAVIMATSARDIETAVASLRSEVVDYLLKPFTRERLAEALTLGRDWHCASVSSEDLHAALQDRLRGRRAAVAADLAEAQDTTAGALEGLIAMLQLHERDGRGHALRVARLAVAMADEIGFDDQMIRQLEQASLLHDIGKLQMPASILSKPAPLDENEWRVMRTHPQLGYDLLSRQSRFADVAEIVLNHHEAFDGSGYPRGLAGEDIPHAARILSVADAYDSMTQPHTQRPALSPVMAMQEIERCSGRQFDPRCAEALGPVLMHAGEERVA